MKPILLLLALASPTFAQSTITQVEVPPLVTPIITVNITGISADGAVVEPRKECNFMFFMILRNYKIEYTT